MSVAEIYWIGVATSMVYCAIKTYIAMGLIKATPMNDNDTDYRTRGLRKLFKGVGYGGLAAFIITAATCIFSLFWFYFLPKSLFLAANRKKA